MKLTSLLASFWLGAVIRGAASFAPTDHHLHHTTIKQKGQQQLQTSLTIRGGGDSMSSSSLSSVLGPAADAVGSALVSGTPLRAVGGMWAVSSLVIVPLTFIRQGYSFSVGYGFSVAAMALTLLSSFDISLSTLTSSTPAILTATTVIYGLRLALFLLLREFSVDSKRKQIKSFDKTPRLKRTPLALSVSLLYAFMCSPALFALRGAVEAGSVLEKIQLVSTSVAAFGMLLESVADQHKYEAKRKSKETEDKFVGPSTWSYKLVRHPNYLGEILFWVGLFGAGSVSFGKSIVAWLCGSLGLAAILSIMLGSSGRLDTKQQEKYGGQPKYEEWKDAVKYSVIPFFK
mmetsp:Transcript_14022/g.21019  ORF Transcript_14022/g.21019 Transcript_14022/m.21019 type:complete len:345 (+) Transcript_14022:69-1103(+)